MFNEYIKRQHVCISVYELFDWWDRLDSDPDNAFDLFTEFLEQAEDTLDINPPTFEDYEDYDNYIKVDLDDDTLFESDYDEFSKRTNDAYKKVKKSDSKPLSSDEFLKELDDWINDNDEDNTSIAYNPYNWNIKGLRGR
jgi:hypothetical protein